jgi:hypothetical protein
MLIEEKHINELYKFTRQHYVEHYDVQTELVDHLANDIEEIWVERPNLSFEEAKKIAFKKFGVFGFMEVVEQKQKQMSKKYWKILWGFMREWFQLPKIMLTLTGVLLSYYLLQFSITKYIFFGVFIIITGYVWVKLRKHKKEMKRKPQKWMLEDMLLLQGNIDAFVLATYPLHFANFVVDQEFTGGVATWLLSIVVTLTVLIIYISVEVIPVKAEKLLEKNYPEYKLSQNV